MNANELADELEIAQGNNNSVELIPEAIAMLRKLDGQLAFRIYAVSKYQERVEAQQAEIEALKKKKEHWENQYIIENKKWKFAEKSFSDLLMRTVNTTHPVKELTDEEIIESLAELEHEQWMKWADTIMQTEKISDSRFARWASCMIPYADLTEEMKEFDRVWARKALAILRKAQEK